MRNCDLEKHQKSCVVAQTRYRRKECDGCEAGEGNMKIEAAKAATPVPSGNKPIQPKKEEVGKVGQETVKAAILRVLERKGIMNLSTLKNFAGQECPKEEWKTAIGELSAAGKIGVKEGIRGGSFKVWRGGVQNPAPANTEKKAAASAPRKPRAKPLSATGKKVAGNKPHSNSAYAEVIADLEAKRQNIDNAIAALKALP